MNDIQKEALDAAVATINGDMGALWITISAILVFFMQAGFTLVEVGFTRGKNAGNIILKNVMKHMTADFCSFRTKLRHCLSN